MRSRALVQTSWSPGRGRMRLLHDLSGEAPAKSEALAMDNWRFNGLRLGIDNDERYQDVGKRPKQAVFFLLLPSLRREGVVLPHRSERLLLFSSPRIW